LATAVQHIGVVSLPFAPEREGTPPPTATLTRTTTPTRTVTSTPSITPTRTVTATGTITVPAAESEAPAIPALDRTGIAVLSLLLAAAALALRRR
jgi:hypothetical protein